MSQSAPDTAEMLLPALREQYRQHALTIRNVCTDTVRMRLISLDRLFDYLGPPQTAAELFARLDQTTLTEFLVDYALRL